MKLQQITNKDPIIIAHVGASKQQNGNGTLQSENDRWQMEEVYRWLIDNLDDQQLSRFKNQSQDFIDLNEGRDFLKENNQYDIVVLHMIYSPYQGYGGNTENSLFNISDQHSPQNWNRRLKSSGAKYIFMFGDGEEVHGKYIGKIDGYVGPSYEGNYLQVYVKERYR